MKAKQVIIMRKDLNMRTGKMIAQGAHASMSILLKEMRDQRTQEEYVQSIQGVKAYDMWLHVDTLFDAALHDWLSGSFTKIVVGCSSEEELLALLKQADEEGLPFSLIKDAGLTEFGGVPTHTCGAIGPAYSDYIDKITGHLKLL